MINLLEDYISRSLSEWGDLSTNPNLCKKVNQAGSFLPFSGNTVVFDLAEATKKALLSFGKNYTRMPVGCCLRELIQLRFI